MDASYVPGCRRCSHRRRYRISLSRLHQNVKPLTIVIRIRTIPLDGVHVLKRLSLALLLPLICRRRCSERIRSFSRSFDERVNRERLTPPRPAAGLRPRRSSCRIDRRDSAPTDGCRLRSRRRTGRSRRAALFARFGGFKSCSTPLPPLVLFGAHVDLCQSRPVLERRAFCRGNRRRISDQADSPLPLRCHRGRYDRSCLWSFPRACRCRRRGAERIPPCATCWDRCGRLHTTV